MDLENWEDGSVETKRLDFEFEAKALHENGEFEGHASIFGVEDMGHDIIVRGAFKRSLAEWKAKDRVPALLWHHNTREPIGVWLEMKEDRRGLFVRGHLLVEDIGQARAAYALIKAGGLSGLSIGFTTVQSEINEKTGVRKIKDVELWEVSLVTFPMLDNARVEDVKAIVPFNDLDLADLVRAWSPIQAERRVRRWAGAEEAPNAKYRSAFVFCDRDNADGFDACKLMIADVIAGELVAVPRAIAAAAAVLMGACGGAGMGPAEKAAASGHLTRYYGKMRDEFDDKTIAAPWTKIRDGDFEGALADVLAATKDLIETERDFESHLREAGFSSNAAKAITAGGFKSADLRDGAGDDTDDLIAVHIAHRKGIRETLLQ